MPPPPRRHHCGIPSWRSPRRRHQPRETQLVDWLDPTRVRPAKGVRKESGNQERDRGYITPSLHRSPSPNVPPGRKPTNLHNPIQSVHRYCNRNLVNTRAPRGYRETGLYSRTGGTGTRTWRHFLGPPLRGRLEAVAAILGRILFYSLGYGFLLRLSRKLPL